MCRIFVNFVMYIYVHIFVIRGREACKNVLGNLHLN